MIVSTFSEVGLLYKKVNRSDEWSPVTSVTDGNDALTNQILPKFCKYVLCVSKERSQMSRIRAKVILCRWIVGRYLYFRLAVGIEYLLGSAFAVSCLPSPVIGCGFRQPYLIAQSRKSHNKYCTVSLADDDLVD